MGTPVCRGGMMCVATLALLVSSLGIANTMLMSVLERGREIGIIKAVGVLPIAKTEPLSIGKVGPQAAVGWDASRSPSREQDEGRKRV